MLRSYRRLLTRFAFGGALLAAATGRCLPNNYWADFAGGLLTSAAETVIVTLVTDALDANAP